MPLDPELVRTALELRIRLPGTAEVDRRVASSPASCYPLTPHPPPSLSPRICRQTPAVFGHFACVSPARFQGSLLNRRDFGDPLEGHCECPGEMDNGVGIDRGNGGRGGGEQRGEIGRTATKQQ